MGGESGGWGEEKESIFISSIATIMIQFCLIAVVAFFSLFFYAASKFHKETMVA